MDLAQDSPGSGTGLAILEDGFNSSRVKALPSITLGLIDYHQGSMHAKQIIITPSTLALLRGGPDLLKKAGTDPLIVYRSRMGELTIYIKRIDKMGLAKDVEIPPGFQRASRLEADLQG